MNDAAQHPHRDARWHQWFRTALHARITQGDAADAAARAAITYADAAAVALRAPKADPVTPHVSPDRPSPADIGSARVHTR